MAACGTLQAGAVNVGDSEKQVLDNLGPPRGRLDSGNLAILKYDRGTVTLVDGKVASAWLVSATEAAEQRAQVERAAAARRAAEAAARRTRIEAGKAEKQKTIADPGFAKRKPAERLAYWEDFQRRYPEVPIDRELAGARQELGTEAAAAGAAERAALAKQIEETEKEIDRLANRQGVGRTAFVEGARELARLRQELARLREKQRELSGK
jgi:hypothetical protein